MTAVQAIFRDPQGWIARHMHWLRWPFLLAVLFTVSIAGAVLQGRTAVAILGLLIGLPVALVGAYGLMRWTAAGLVLLMPANMLVPLSIGTGSGTSINATILVIFGMAGLWIFDMINNQRRIWLHRSRPIVPLLLMLVAATISFLGGQLPWFTVAGASLSAQIGGLAIFFICALAFLLAAHQIRELRWLEWMTWAFVIVGTSFLLVRLVPPLYRQGGRVFQYGSFSSQFWLWFIMITFSQAWLNTKLHKAWRLGLLVACVMALYAVVVLEFDWKSGWIPPLIGLAAMMGLYSWRLFALGLIGGAFALPVAIARLIATDEYSYGTRLDAWLILGEIIKVNPLLGLGPANYYWYTPLYAIRGYSVEFNSHNQYIDLLAQIGIIGTAVVVWFLAEIIWLAWKLKDRVPEGFARAYVYGALGGGIALAASGMLGDWFLPFVYNVGFVGMRSAILGWVFLGALVALEHMYPPRPG